MSQVGTILVMEITRPIDAGQLSTYLRENPYDFYYAFSPLAAFFLDEQGLPYKILEDVVNSLEFQNFGRLNTQLIREILSTLEFEDGGALEGFYYQARSFLDNLLLESLKAKHFNSAELTLLTDAPHGESADVRRQSAWPDRSSNRLLNVGKHIRILQLQNRNLLIRRKLASLSGPKILTKLSSMFFQLRNKFLRYFVCRPSVLSKFNYDWAPYRSTYQAVFNTIGHQEIYAEVALQGAKSGARTGRRDIASRVAAQFIEQIVPRLSWLPDDDRLNIILSELGGALRDYILQLFLFREQMPTVIATKSIRLALCTCCNDAREFLTTYYLKQNGVPVVFYQHGGYMHQAYIIQHYERAPATLNFVYGLEDKNYFRTLAGVATVEAVGSSICQRPLRSIKTRKKSALYVLDGTVGGCRTIDGNLHCPEPDGVSMFRRHIKIIDLFARNLEWTLVLRPAPSFYSGGLYEPLIEHIRNIGAANISFDFSTSSSNDFLGRCEWNILDYFSTSILEALRKSVQNVICYVGVPYRVDEPLLTAVRRGFMAAVNADELIALIESHIFNNVAPLCIAEARAWVDRGYCDVSENRYIYARVQVSQIIEDAMATQNQSFPRS